MPDPSRKITVAMDDLEKVDKRFPSAEKGKDASYNLLKNIALLKEFIVLGIN